MSVVEYAEKILGIHLYPFQKQFLQKLENLPPNSRLIYIPNRGMMIIKDGESKEAGNVRTK